MFELINPLLDQVLSLVLQLLHVLQIDWLPLAESPFSDQLGIEGEKSRQFSVGIFIFLVFAIFVFLMIALAYMFKGKSEKMKLGEKIMFGWILFGLVAAVAFGASQLLQGYLF